MFSCEFCDIFKNTFLYIYYLFFLVSLIVIDRKCFTEAYLGFFQISMVKLFCENSCKKHRHRCLVLNKPLFYYQISSGKTSKIPTGIYLLRVNNRNTRTRFGICSKLTTHQNDVMSYCLVLIEH